MRRSAQQVHDTFEELVARYGGARARGGTALSLAILAIAAGEMGLATQLVKMGAAEAELADEPKKGKKSDG